MAYEINLFEDIVSGLTSKKFIAELNKAGVNEDIIVNINSDGGSLLEAFSIYDYLNSEQGQRYKISGKIFGMAASAATIIAIACKAKIGDNSYFMIHDAYMPEKDPNTGETVLLEDMNSKIANIYAKATGMGVEKIRQMMKAETFMDAASAVEMKFCTGVVEGLAIAAIAAKANKSIHDWKALLDNRTYEGYPESAVLNAQKALAWIEQYGIEVNQLDLARAKQIAERKALSADSITHIANIKEVAITNEAEPWKDTDYLNTLLAGGLSDKIWANKNTETETDKLTDSIVNKLLKHPSMTWIDKIKAMATGTNVQAKTVPAELSDGTKINIETVDEDGKIAVGDMVMLEDGSPAPDAEHLLSDGVTTVTTEGGVITAIGEKEPEASMDEKPDAKAGIEALAALIGELTVKVDDLSAKINGTPVAKAPQVAAKARTIDRAPQGGKAQPEKMSTAVNHFAKFAAKKGIQLK
jgi:ATP-dependent protease ClpP protease subunit